MSKRKIEGVGTVEVEPTKRTRNAPRDFADRHPWLSLGFAIIGALALIAVFTPVGESDNGDAQQEPSENVTALATELDRLTEDIEALARSLVEREWEPTATPEPTATSEPTPCVAPTGVRCGEPEPTPGPSSIGGTDVPDGLTCQEDELIGFTGEGPDVIGCVHVDSIREGSE